MDDNDQYQAVTYRRLALKPGMPVLWQVNGRSELTWKVSLQLHHYQVESRPLSIDPVLLARCVRPVLHGGGAP